MLLEVINWGLKPSIVTGDSWYSSIANLKFLKNQKLGFLFGIEKNRTVSNQPGKYQQVSSLDIPDEGLVTHLKEFGFIKLLRKDFKKGDSRHYVLYLPDSKKLAHLSRQEFITIHDTHWGIETFHRAIKQICGADAKRPSRRRRRTARMRCVDLWCEILMPLKHTYFVHFKHLSV